MNFDRFRDRVSCIKYGDPFQTVYGTHHLISAKIFGESFMENVIWDRPVGVHGLLIFGPRAAWDFMLHRWPPNKDMNFASASDAILAALDGRGCPDFAREKFEDALKSAQISR